MQTIPGPYHLRRKEKTIQNETEMLDVIKGQCVMTIAMCRESEPYLVSLNYGYDTAGRCFYFHCADDGKKMDFLMKNPVVWGQVLEDCGYLPGQCDHAFRCVMFHGKVDFLATEAEKMHALEVMINHCEPDPEPVKARLLVKGKLDKVIVGRIHIDDMSGKQAHTDKQG